MMLHRPAFWAEKSIVSLLLWPVSLVFRSIAFLRRFAFKKGLLSSWRSPVPVVIIGNISVGGAGKTPLVIALSELLTYAGYSIGIVTRGYGGKSGAPVVATSSSDTSLVGDESVLIARRTGLPVVVSKSRVAAVQHLISSHSIDCVLCDDGLQHYKLERDLEIAVVDADYRFGNGFCLPSGPLREPLARLNKVDFTVYSGSDRIEAGYSLVGDELVSIGDEAKRQSLEELSGSAVHAVAGIASPEKFYKHLRRYGIEVIEHPFADHAIYDRTDLEFQDNVPVVMTEKDMVKCRDFKLDSAWYLPVTASLDDELAQQISNCIEGIIAMRVNNADR